MKKHSKALLFFAVSKQIPIVYSADRGRAEIISDMPTYKSDSCSIATQCHSTICHILNEMLLTVLS